MGRYFIAIELPESVKDILHELQKKFQHLDLFSGTYVRDRKFHLTLRFLGEISDGDIQKLQEQLSLVKHPVFSLQLDSLGVFDEEYIRVLWAGIVGDGLQELYQEVQKYASHYGESEQSFHPHVTLARVKALGNRDDLLDAVRAEVLPQLFWPVEFFVLKKTIWIEGGHIHEDVERYWLTDDRDIV